MTIPDHRLSTEVLEAPYIPPEELDKFGFLEDYEAGPIAPEDTTAGMNYQTWKLTYNDPDFTLTPMTSGTPYVVLSDSGAKQVSFCFDQNARATIVYIKGTSAFLYWYDTQAAQFVTTEFTSVKSAMLSLDDKRDRQVGANDMILWYTSERTLGINTLFTREQRDRFDTEYSMKEDVYPYLWKAGMHEELRGQITLLKLTGTGGGTPPIPPGPVLPQANLDFELGDVYWAKSGDFAINQTDPYAGSWSAILNTIPANNSVLENNVYTVIAAGQLILLSYYIKGSTATTVKVGVNFYNAVKALVASNITTVNVTTGWVLESREIIAPVDAVYAKIHVESFNTDGIVSIDEFVFDANLYVVELAADEYFQVELDSLEYFRAEP
jgi:hypothetical protein